MPSQWPPQGVRPSLGQRGACTLLSRAERRPHAPVLEIQRLLDALEHPGATEIEALEVREFEVGPVGHGSSPGWRTSPRLPALEWGCDAGFETMAASTAMVIGEIEVRIGNILPDNCVAGVHSPT